MVASIFMDGRGTFLQKPLFADPALEMQTERAAIQNIPTPTPEKKDA